MATVTDTFLITKPTAKEAEAMAVELFRHRHRQLGRVIGETVWTTKRSASGNALGQGWSVTVETYRMGR